VPKISSSVNYFVDGVYLSEIGNHKIRSLTLEQPKKKRNKSVAGKGDAGILATIESVVSGGMFHLITLVAKYTNGLRPRIIMSKSM
jgi:hypothetical protein